MTSILTSVIWRGSAAYEEARVGRVFNYRRPKRYPNGIIEVTSVPDVVGAVLLARQMNLRVSVRSGGHSWAAWSVRDGALLIDMGKFKCIELDEAGSLVKVSPSTTGRMLNEYLSSKDKMFAGGHCPDVGLGGFLLQGGMGWNCKNWGWACEKIVAVEAVTAEGTVVICNDKQNSDLLWAAKGAGPGFPAVVTAFILEVRDSMPAVKSSTFLWPLSMYKIVMDWTIKIAPECDESMEVVALSLRPDLTEDPVIMAHFVTFQKSPEEAISSLEKVNTSRPPGAIVESICKDTSIASEYEAQALANPEKHRYTCDNAYINNAADVTEVLRTAFTTLPAGSKTFALWYSMNPCSRRRLPDMALSMQSDHYFALYTVWEEIEEDERCNKWVKDMMSQVERHAVGAYLGDADFQERRSKYWDDANAVRLMALRRKWDPTGLVCGYLDEGDKSGINGLSNIHEWQK